MISKTDYSEHRTQTLISKFIIFLLFEIPLPDSSNLSYSNKIFKWDTVINKDFPILFMKIVWFSEKSFAIMKLWSPCITNISIVKIN